jgi:hypothetical protein
VAFTTGSVVFVGASGVYQQDNANFNIIDSSPYKLKIGAGGNLSLFLANDATKTGIQFYNSGVGGIGIRSDGADIAISTAGSSFSPNTWGSDLVTFKQGGNVGIGNTTASQMLTVGASEQFKVTSAGAVTAAQETITGSSAVNLALTNTTSSLTYTLYSANSASNGFNGFGIFDGTSYRLKIDGSTGNLTVANVLTSYNGITLAGLGQPIIVAVADATAQAANIGTTPLYTVPASGAGMYRLSCYVVLTRAATTSSTLPGCYVVYTDKDSSVSNGNAQATVTSTGNTVGTTAGSNGTGLGQIVMNAAASSTINYVVTGYTSVGATTMQYAVHIKLEYVGP